MDKFHLNWKKNLSQQTEIRWSKATCGFSYIFYLEFQYQHHREIIFTSYCKLLFIKKNFIYKSWYLVFQQYFHFLKFIPTLLLSQFMEDGKKLSCSLIQTLWLHFMHASHLIFSTKKVTNGSLCHIQTRSLYFVEIFRWKKPFLYICLKLSFFRWIIKHMRTRNMFASLCNAALDYSSAKRQS